MRFHNFWCISFLSSEFLNHLQKPPKSQKKICSITIFHQDPEKNTFTGLKTPQNCLIFFLCLFQRIMNKSLRTLLHFWVFSNSHRSNPSPHTTNNAGCMYPEFFSEFQLCIGWGEGELQENFENAALTRLFGDWVETLLLPAFFRVNLSATYNAHQCLALDRVSPKSQRPNLKEKNANFQENAFFVRMTLNRWQTSTNS